MYSAGGRCLCGPHGGRAGPLRRGARPEAAGGVLRCVEPPGDYDGRLVGGGGYPAFDLRNPVDVQNQAFGGIYNVKRLQPGKAGGRREVASCGHSVSAVTHDASTLAWVATPDPQCSTQRTAPCLGLHFAGVYLDANFFVPAWELARDDRVVKAGANFVDGGPDLALSGMRL